MKGINTYHKQQIEETRVLLDERSIEVKSEYALIFVINTFISG
ncbi:MAG TPA: hypothetical protein VIP70_13375 [Nitrososphaeraceae archaeon]